MFAFGLKYSGSAPFSITDSTKNFKLINSSGESSHFAET